jgi:hypothetical protein
MSEELETVAGMIKRHGDRINGEGESELNGGKARGKGWHLIEGPKGGYESGEPDREASSWPWKG